MLTDEGQNLRALRTEPPMAFRFFSGSSEREVRLRNAKAEIGATDGRGKLGRISEAAGSRLLQY